MNITLNLKKMIQSTLKNVLRLMTKVEDDTVFFISFSGESYSDNPKAISEALHTLSPKTKIVWGFKNIEAKKGIVPNYVHCIDMNNFMMIHKTYYSSKVVVSNFSFPYIKKSSKQYFVQTWHGDRAFKKVLCDSPFVSKDYFVSESEKGYCDLAIAGSDYGERQYLSAFRYSGEILKEGTPRDDVLIRRDERKIIDIKKILNVDENKKILLYAPTLRRENATQKTEQQSLVDINETLSCLQSKYGNDWVCLMRAHPAIKGLCGVEYGDKIINVSTYEDMAELLLISDMLITDYSSCAGDFALTGNPVVLFQSDIQEYLEKDRSFYFDINDSPYYVAHDQNELNQIISRFNDSAIKQNCQDILDFYGSHESGKSAEIIAQKIVDWLQKYSD